MPHHAAASTVISRLGATLVPRTIACLVWQTLLDYGCCVPDVWTDAKVWLLVLPSQEGEDTINGSFVAWQLGTKWQTT